MTDRCNAIKKKKEKRIFFIDLLIFILEQEPISFEIIAVVLAVDDRVAPSAESSTVDPASPFDRLRGGVSRDCPGCSLSRPWLAPPRLDPRVSMTDAEIPRSLLSRAAWNSA